MLLVYVYRKLPLKQSWNLPKPQKSHASKIYRSDFLRPHDARLLAVRASVFCFYKSHMFDCYNPRVTIRPRDRPRLACSYLLR